MLGLLAAATIAAQPAPQVKPLVLADRIHVYRTQPTKACKDAAALQTSYEPALLFREQDRADARARKLIELPMAEACLASQPSAGR